MSGRGSWMPLCCHGKGFMHPQKPLLQQLPSLQKRLASPNCVNDADFQLLDLNIQKLSVHHLTYSVTRALKINNNRLHAARIFFHTFPRPFVLMILIVACNTVQGHIFGISFLNDLLPYGKLSHAFSCLLVPLSRSLSCLSFQHNPCISSHIPF